MIKTHNKLNSVRSELEELKTFHRNSVEWLKIQWNDKFEEWLINNFSVQSDMDNKNKLCCNFNTVDEMVKSFRKYMEE